MPVGRASSFLKNSPWGVPSLPSPADIGDMPARNSPKPLLPEAKEVPAKKARGSAATLTPRPNIPEASPAYSEPHRYLAMPGDIRSTLITAALDGIDFSNVVLPAGLNIPQVHDQFDRATLARIRSNQGMYCFLHRDTGSQSHFRKYVYLTQGFLSEILWPSQ